MPPKTIGCIWQLCICVCVCVWWGLCCVASGSDEIKHLTALYTQTQHARDQTYFITYKQPDISVVSALTEHTHLYPHVHTRAAIKGKRHRGGLDENSQFHLYSTKSQSQSQLILKRGTFLKPVSAVTTNPNNVNPAACVHSKFNINNQYAVQKRNIWKWEVCYVISKTVTNHLQQEREGWSVTPQLGLPFLNNFPASGQMQHCGIDFM